MSPKKVENSHLRSTLTEQSSPDPHQHDSQHEYFMAHAMQIMGENGGYKPTERQVDKILELQEKGMDYTHLERTRISPRQYLELGILVTFILAFFGLLYFVSQNAREYLGETIAGVIAFLTGGIGGYGFAKSKSKKDEE